MFGQQKQKYTQYNKINQNSEKVRGQDCCWKGRLLPIAPLSFGPES